MIFFNDTSVSPRDDNEEIMFISEATALTCLILSEAELRYPDGMELRWSVTASAGQTLLTSVFPFKKNTAATCLSLTHVPKLPQKGGSKCM